MRVAAYILFSPRCWLPKLAIVAAIAYWIGPVDLIPNSVPVFGHLDEVGFALVALAVARFLAGENLDLARAAPQRDVARSGNRGRHLAYSTRSALLFAGLTVARQLPRQGKHVSQARRRVAAQFAASRSAPDVRTALFRLLGYRLWWIARTQWARRQSQMRNLVVIGGAPRSGTTLLRSMLGRHRDIVSGPEATVFLHRLSSPADLAGRLNADASVIEAWQRDSHSQMEFIERCAASVLAASGKSVWAEKTPWNVLRFGFVRRRFPHARLVHIVRDGRDVVCSLRREPFSKTDDAAWFSNTAARRCALQWRQAVGAGLRWRGHPAYHEIRYEDLVADPEPVMRHLLLALGLPWDPAVLDGGRPDTAEDEDARKAAGKIFANSVGRWRRELSDESRAALSLLTGPLLMRAGYTADPNWTTQATDPRPLQS